MAEAIKLNLGAGTRPLDGFVNLDKTNGWMFEHGLGLYANESIEGITVSHALMYVPEKDWPFVFSEFWRVLAAGGVIRITEDATDDPHSERFGGFYDAVTLTSLSRVTRYLEFVGFRAVAMIETSSLFIDESLMQSWHGGSPKAFFVEGIKDE